MSNLITVEQAKRLNKLGCKTQKLIVQRDRTVFVSIKQRITVSEALDWIRGEKKIDCAVNLVLSKCYEGVKILDGEFSSGLLLEVLTSQYESHPLAESALFDELLTYLEENNHGNK